MACSSRSYTTPNISVLLASVPVLQQFPSYTFGPTCQLSGHISPHHGIAVTLSSSPCDPYFCFSSKWDFQKLVASPQISESLPLAAHKHI